VPGRLQFQKKANLGYSKIKKSVRR
jgi:hypothetical protein